MTCEACKSSDAIQPPDTAVVMRRQSNAGGSLSEWGNDLYLQQLRLAVSDSATPISANAISATPSSAQSGSRDQNNKEKQFSPSNIEKQKNKSQIASVSTCGSRHTADQLDSVHGRIIDDEVFIEKELVSPF